MDTLVARATRDASPAVAEVAEVERLWLIYASDERYRNPTALARRAGVPRKRVEKLIPAFMERWAQETASFRAAAKPYLESRMALLVDAVATRAQDIIEHGSDADAVRAMRLVVDIIGVKDGQGPQVVVDNRTVALVQGGITDIEQVRKLVRSSLNGNIEQVETR